MPQVNVPGVGTLSFPDGMSQADMAAAIQKNYPQIHGPQTQAPDDSPFLKGIKDLGREAGRVAVKTVSAVPLMAMDAGVGVRNLANKIAGDTTQYTYPSDTVNQALNSVLPAPTNTAGKVSEGLSTLIASLGMPGPSSVNGVVTPAARVGADVVKNASLMGANKSGYVVPPSQTNAPPLAMRLAEGLGGKHQTLLAAIDNNQGVTNALAARAIGQHPDMPLTQTALQAVRKEAIDNGYAPVRNIGQVPVDDAHIQAAEAIAAGQRGAANVDPRFGNQEITSIAEAMKPKPPMVPGRAAAPGVTVPASGNPESPFGAVGASSGRPAPGFRIPGAPALKPSVQKDPLTGLPVKPTETLDSSDIVDAISALRAKADDAYAAGAKTLGAAYRKAASAYESLIDRHLSNSDDPAAASMLQKFREARILIAKTHDVEGALNGDTGNVNAVKLAQANKAGGGKMTGDLATIASFGNAFPKAAKVSDGVAPEVSPVDLYASLIAAPSTFGASLAAPGARVAARNAALSARGQFSLLQPPGKSLTPSALRSAFQNPTVFENLFGPNNR